MLAARAELVARLPLTSLARSPVNLLAPATGLGLALGQAVVRGGFLAAFSALIFY